MVTALALLVSGLAAMAVLINAIPLYGLRRLPTEAEHRASLCALVLMFICTLLLFGVLL